MPLYKAPLRDIRFVLHEVFDYADAVGKLPGYEEATPDVVDAVLEEAAKLCENEIQPLNLPGDKEGCSYENGVVRTPKGFKEAYETFRAGGWNGLTCDPKYGGQGLPKVVGFAFEEMITSANMSFGMYPGLSHGAYNAIELHANDALKNQYLPKLADGSWSGTMCLTEPHCGTDLGLIKTRAVPTEDGAYRITGTKIFISAGEHDLADNIIHLVLARIEGAPAGIKGVSLFVVPKFLVKPDGSLGARNGVTCGSIEHKMGIHGNSTCVMNYDNATGWLIGEENKGMQGMFVMMNEARLGVAVQGLAQSEVAYQNAVAYARERLQGRSISGVKAPDKPADPIIVHPDVRRTLLTIRAFNEQMRKDIHARIRKTAEAIAQSAGGSATATIAYGYDVTHNHEKLTERAVGTLRRVAGGENVFVIPKVTGSEDFSAYQKVIPGFFFFLGVKPPDLPPEKTGSNHSPLFLVDEAQLKNGVRALASLVLDYLAGR